MLLVKTFTAPSIIHGTGLFAGEFIPQGTVIWKFDDRIDHLIDKESVNSLPELARNHVLRYCGLLEQGKYLQTGDNDRFINHSATPNTISLPGIGEMTARRDIYEGEEITEDYRAFDFSEERIPYTKASQRRALEAVTGYGEVI